MATIYTARYLVSGDAPPVEGGALLVAGGRIHARGTQRELRQRHPAVEVTEFADALLVPLLINAHTHLELTDFPSWAGDADRGGEPQSFVGWIMQLIEVKKRLRPKDYETALGNGIARSIAAGSGAIGDILAHHSLRRAYQGCSLDGNLYLETLGRDPALIRRVENELHQALQDGGVADLQIGVSPHAPYTVKSDYLRRLYGHCRKQGLACSTHVAEAAAEVELIQQGRGELASTFYPYVGWENFVPQATGLRPIAYLDQVGGLFPGNLLVHGVQLTAAEIARLGEKRMHLALCPRSNAKLKVGKAPAGELYRAGVQLALGTDSMASSDSLSIWDEMAFAADWFGGELDAPTLFQLATLGGARALGVDGRLGTLEVGKKAGFQVLQPQTQLASADIFDYFVSPACGRDIVQVFHDGQARLSGLKR